MNIKSTNLGRTRVSVAKRLSLDITVPVPNCGCLPISLKTSEVDHHHGGKTKPITIPKGRRKFEVTPMTAMPQIPTARTHDMYTSFFVSYDISISVLVYLCLQVVISVHSFSLYNTRYTSKARRDYCWP